MEEFRIILERDSQSYLVSVSEDMFSVTLDRKKAKVYNNVIDATDDVRKLKELTTLKFLILKKEK